MHWNGFIWVAWTPSKKMKQSLSLLLLINDGIGRVSLGMREKGGVTGQGVKMDELMAIDNVVCNPRDILWKRR